MRKIVECVPNFSEGRRPEVIEAIVRELRDIPDVFLLDTEMDADHHRTVVTIVGDPHAVKEAAFRMIKAASERIDLTLHRGEHPRMGATDVVPFIPLKNVTTEECVHLARDLGQRVGSELRIPVYLYEEAATRPDRKDLANIRKGQFEGLREEIGSNPERTPDFGPNTIHPTAGATAIGARFFLVAYNVNLETQDLDLAKKIAREIRASNGGFPCVKAMGFDLADRNLVQISMNMVNYSETSLATVYTAIRKKAEQAGVKVLESEIVGLVPREALSDTAVEFLRIKNFSPEQIIENRVAQVIGEHQPSEDSLLDAFASASPAPGGGSASALAGALAAALASMVSKLTLGKKKYQAVEAEMLAVRDKAHQLQTRLKELIAEDSLAYTTVIAAFKLPKETAEEKTVRRNTIQEALKSAANIPLETMKYALEVLTLTEVLAEKGNSNAITDTGCAVHLAQTAIEGAALNVSINLSSLNDETFIDGVRAEVDTIRKRAQKCSQHVLTIIESTIS